MEASQPYVRLLAGRGMWDVDVAYVLACRERVVCLHSLLPARIVVEGKRKPIKPSFPTKSPLQIAKT